MQKKLLKSNLTTGMKIECRKPAHPLHGHLWSPCVVGEIKTVAVEIILDQPVLGAAIHFIGRSTADGRILDDSGNEIEIRERVIQ